MFREQRLTPPQQIAFTRRFGELEQHVRKEHRLDGYPEILVVSNIVDGRLSGADNGCHATTYQVTPSCSLPFSIGGAKFAFDGFVDLIGSHGQCARQVLSQPQLKVDIGGFWSKPDHFYAGVEWQYWRNKFGIEGLDESFPQLLATWKF